MRPINNRCDGRIREFFANHQGEPQMTVRLKGEFDKMLQSSHSTLKQIHDTLLQRQSSTWSETQLEDLADLFNAINALHAAVTLMAMQVRDD
jgi:hypothetical protein